MQPIKNDNWLIMLINGAGVAAAYILLALSLAKIPRCAAGDQGVLGHGDRAADPVADQPGEIPFR